MRNIGNMLKFWTNKIMYRFKQHFRSPSSFSRCQHEGNQQYSGIQVYSMIFISTQQYR